MSGANRVCMASFTATRRRAGPAPRCTWERLALNELHRKAGEHDDDSRRGDTERRHYTSACSRFCIREVQHREVQAGKAE